MSPTLFHLLLILSLFVPSQPLLQPTENSFISLLISQNGLDFVKDLLVDKAISSLTPLEIPQIEKTMKIPILGNVHTVLSNITIYRIDVTSSYVKPGETGVAIVASGTTCNLSMNWYYSYSSWAVPFKISDHGSASVQPEVCQTARPQAREDRLGGDELASRDLVAAVEAGVLRAESVTELVRTNKMTATTAVVPLNAGAEPGGVAAALSLLLHRWLPLSREVLPPADSPSDLLLPPPPENSFKNSFGSLKLVEGMEVGLTLGLVNRGGSLELSLMDCGCYVKDITITLDGGASWLYQALPKEIKVDDTASLNVTFVNDLSLSNSSIGLKINGLFTRNGEDALPNNYLKNSQLPVSCTDSSKMLGISLEEDVFNSASTLYYNAKFMQWIVNEVPDKSLLNTAGWRFIVPQLYKKYPNDDMNMNLSLSSPPVIRISANNIDAIVYVDLIIDVLEGPDVIPVACISLWWCICKQDGGILAEGIEFGGGGTFIPAASD
ncbi:lipid-binding serum glycoprotein family protein [Actinidia rufa]|uniref:Lipid-binding serum glycoprotein family protein n=1 Tax=Actinidia rufa TaxID=165716 RepID=A0A7J0FFZ6_9ERIC|nr:lipid-binding serum glycoprotein family protein [Actinidia rufa]